MDAKRKTAAKVKTKPATTKRYVVRSSKRGKVVVPELVTDDFWKILAPKSTRPLRARLDEMARVRREAESSSANIRVC